MASKEDMWMSHRSWQLVCSHFLRIKSKDKRCIFSMRQAVVLSRVCYLRHSSTLSDYIDSKKQNQISLSQGMQHRTFDTTDMVYSFWPDEYLFSSAVMERTACTVPTRQKSAFNFLSLFSLSSLHPISLSSFLQGGKKKAKKKKVFCLVWSFFPSCFFSLTTKPGNPLFTQLY